MSEEQKEETKQESTETIESDDDGDQSAVPETIRRANALNQELAKQQEASEKVLKEMRDLAAYNQLGGVTDGGTEIVKKELSPQEYSELALQGKLPDVK